VSRLLAEWVVRAYLAGAVVGVTAPVVGSFLVQRRLALIGDGMGHLAFAGVALGVVLGASPLWGALVVAAAGALLLEGLRSRGRLAGDVSLAIVFYVGIALGSVLLSAAGRFDASLLGVLFGSILTASWIDVAEVAALCALILAATAASYRGLLAVALDEETARASGLPVERLNLLLLGLVALLVAAGMRVVGLLLVASLLVIPVAAGSRLAHSFRGALLWGAAAGVSSVLLGLVAAVWQGEIAPGGTIVLASAAIFGLASALGRRAARRHPRRALP
jgi:zinc transport system permease protein